MFDEREVNDGLKSRENKFRCSQRNSERNEKRPGWKLFNFSRLIRRVEKKEAKSFPSDLLSIMNR